MHRTVSYLTLTVVLSGGGAGLNSAQPIRAEILQAQATPYRADDPDVAAFNLKFDVRLANGSGESVNIPRAETGDGGTTRVAVLGVQAKQRDGTWAKVVQSSWYDTGSIKYEPCTLLPPGGAAEFANVPGGLLLLKSQLAGLGNKPTVRFHLMSLCRQPDGKVVTNTVTTGAFDLRLPSLP
jgi:hypothetical protein